MGNFRGKGDFYSPLCKGARGIIFIGRVMGKGVFYSPPL